MSPRQRIWRRGVGPPAHALAHGVDIERAATAIAHARRISTVMAASPRRAVAGHDARSVAPSFPAGADERPW